MRQNGLALRKTFFPKTALSGWLAGQPWAPRSPLRRGTRRARAHLPLIRPGDTLIAHSGCFQPLHAENHCFLHPVPRAVERAAGDPAGPAWSILDEA